MSLDAPPPNASREVTASAEPLIVGLNMGAIYRDRDGKAQVYFGDETVHGLTEYDRVKLRNDAVEVDMYTIDGSETTDYAVVTVIPPAHNRTATERGRVLRSGSTNAACLIERTPIQKFTSPRIFQDIPISGRARWLAINPQGKFSTGLFDDRDPTTHNSVMTFGEGWTFVWIAEGSRPFVFGELCSPRFIDKTNTCPIGEDGIIELEPEADFSDLPDRFRELFALYESGEHLRERTPAFVTS